MSKVSVNTKEEIARVLGHRMEAFITWERYYKLPKKNMQFCTYLYRRYNDLTDQLLELDSVGGYKHYDMDFKTGEILEV